jgi:hypothetical protein
MFEAMWKQAIIDETKKQIFRLTTDVIEHLYPDAINLIRKNKSSLSAVERMVNQVYGANIEKTIKTIEIEIGKTSIKKAIQIKIYKESQRWPKNSKEPDQSFERKYLEIKIKLLSAIDVLVLTEYNKIVRSI